MFFQCLIAACVLYYCLPSGLCSYLDYPRIHFAGEFRVDTGAINNEKCNFRMDSNLTYAEPPEIHDYGSNSFKFYNTKVTGMVDSAGNPVTVNSDLDIVTNINRPFTKLVDLDVDAQFHSTLYGMEFGIRNAGEELLLHGMWTPCVIAHNMWRKINCFTNTPQQCLLKSSSGGESFSSQSATTLTNIRWASDNVIQGTFAQTLKKRFEKSGFDHLAIRLTLHSYKYGSNRAGLGWVEGVIGIPSDDDTLCIPGQRIMLPVSDAQPANLDYSICEQCIYKGEQINNTEEMQWMGPTPFKVNVQDDNAAAEIHVDFSSSVVTDSDRNICDIKTLKLAVCGNNECDDFEFIKEGEFLHYTDESTYTNNGGIYSFTVKDADIITRLQNNPLAVVQVSQDVSQDNQDNAYDVGQQKPINVKAAQGETPVVLLKEHEYFIRPKGYYVGRLDTTEPQNAQEAYITRYGTPPDDITLTINAAMNPFTETRDPIPADGVLGKFLEYKNGVAKIVFSKNTKINMPELRTYKEPPCEDDNDTTIPIDGQVYYFYYGIEGHEDAAFEDTATVFRSYSDVSYDSRPTWVKDVGPIFTQYARLTPMMGTILDMSDYRDVIKPHNINLLKKSLNLDFSDPAYMPATRDLSPTKMAMILEWLNDNYPPLYGQDHQQPPPPKCKKPLILGLPDDMDQSFQEVPNPGYPPIPDNRCDTTKAMLFDNAIHLYDPAFLSVFDITEENECYHIQQRSNENTLDDFVTLLLEDERLPMPQIRPLFAHTVKSHLQDQSVADSLGDEIELMCNKSSVVRQLQTALKLEWATLPIYLTTLYSIPEGCNVEIYNVIRSVVMQEMLHFALVGNMLIALGEVPEIDSPDFAPSYPGQLPGCVLPGLTVTLKKLTLDHIKKVLMMIELPAHTKVAGNMTHDLFTIGTFYDEIRNCISSLDDDIFDKSTEKFQVQWEHWDSESSVGNLSPITDRESALDAINIIVSQGEGSGLLDPMDIENKTYAHFFKFEEIYCGHHLRQVDEDPPTYSYSGKAISFDAAKVAPMRPNPTTKNLPADTICYTESRIFHDAYRNFLRKLQEVFNGSENGKPEDIFVAIEMMEALQLNAKRLMWINFDGSQTCGPVWDYNF